jgi:hypothetical protein
MVAPAGFLYGDATPSPLKSDFIAFLRDAVDYAAEVLGSDARTAAAARDVERLAEQTEREITAAEELATDVARALEGPSLRAPASLASRCAARLQREARDLVRSEADAARAAVVAERARFAQTASRESEVCMKAFEANVRRHTVSSGRPSSTSLPTMRSRACSGSIASSRGSRSRRPRRAGG